MCFLFNQRIQIKECMCCEAERCGMRFLLFLIASVLNLFLIGFPIFTFYFTSWDPIACVTTYLCTIVIFQIFGTYRCFLSYHKRYFTKEVQTPGLKPDEIGKLRYSKFSNIIKVISYGYECFQLTYYVYNIYSLLHPEETPKSHSSKILFLSFRDDFYDSLHLQ